MKEQVLVWVLSSSVENLNLASPTTFLSRLYGRASVGLGVIKFSRKFEFCITDHFLFSLKENKNNAFVGNVRP